LKQTNVNTATRAGRAAWFRHSRLPAFILAGLAAAVAAPGAALAADAAAADAPSQTANPPPKTSTEVSDVVVNGIPYRETVLPTRLSTSSAYGLNLNVMDTPRNTTLLSTTQLETLNIDDPRAFSYLTSSSYTDAAFGTPNIPRIRTQYADLFYNGMRDSMTQNGYGVPVNFDAVSNIAITKGPASVIDGPGPGVGGEVDFLTKRPNMDHPTGMVSATFDSVENRRWVVDLGAPIIRGDLAFLLSYSGEDSNSYFYGHYMRKNALYAAVRWQPNDKYKLDFNTEINVEQYTEEVGINRANQALIDNNTYLTGETLGGPANIMGFGTVIDLTGNTQLNPKVTIDQTPGTSSRGWLYNAQLIQTYAINDNLTLENNTLFMFQNSDNQEGYYYADESQGSYTFESRTDVKGDFDVSFGDVSFRNQFVAGGTWRFAHVYYISDFNAEAVSIWDLSGNASDWVLPAADQDFEDAVPYKSVFGRTQYGVLGRDYIGGGNTGVSDLYDTAVFYQDRMEFTSKFSVLFGTRIDALQDHTRDPLGCSPDGSFSCLDYLPAEHTTGVYGLGSANFSAVYKFQPNISGYLTFDWTQSPPNPDGGEGGINAYGIVPDSKLMRGNSFLYEGGAKFNLLDNRLFVGVAAFDQKHQVPTGPGDTLSLAANTYGVEVEGNYQPTRNLYATASYSYIRSILDSPPSFYDFPAQAGLNIDGGGSLLASNVLFLPNQKVDQPDQPQHVFNFLANYKFSNGFGVRTGMQVTGPVSLTASALVDMTALQGQYNNYWACGCNVPLPNSITPVPGIKGPNGDEVGYYKSPIIPWQFTWNAAIFYQFADKYTITFSVYNLTDQKNWQPSPGYYGNDFLVRSDPRTYEVRLQAKF
jgi:outer membrane receptor protein involved in Fe transport